MQSSAHQTLGIRRLVHRGMVRGLTAVVTLAILFLLVLAVGLRGRRISPRGAPRMAVRRCS